MSDTDPILDSAVVDLGGPPDGLVKSTGGPVIQILNPKLKQVVVGTTMTIQAKVTDKDGINDQKVTTWLKTTAGYTTPVVMSNAPAPDVYEAKIDISKYSGMIFLFVEAYDMDKNGNTEYIDFERDSGPTIHFFSPIEASRHNASMSINIMVTDKSGVTSFTLKIGNYTIPLKKVTTDPKKVRYTGTIKFDDKVFKPALSGKQVLIATATNTKTAKSIKQLNFVVDDVGPEILITSQKAGELIGGVIKISAKVTDLAGVLPSTVRCIIGNDQDTRSVALFAGTTSGVYEGQFDTRTLTQYQIWPVMSFRATDTLGNESHQDIQLGLDNGQPIVEMDPPEDFYLARLKKKDVECPHAIDPVGAYAADDLDRVPQITRLRARIEDQGNYSPSAYFVPISKVLAASVYMYVLDDTSKPLVVDTTGDGFCDDINPEIIPLGSKPLKGEAVAVNLSGVSPTGSPNFKFISNPALVPGCEIWGTDQDEPKDLCYNTEATVAIPYLTSNEAAIYTIPPIVTSAKGWQCMGLPFDFKANNFNDGWVCTAVVATDNLGSRGVSPPLRLKVDQKWSGIGSSKVPAALTASEAAGAPSCTGTLNKATGKVNSTPCKFRNPRENSNCADKNACTKAECLTLTNQFKEFPQMFSNCHVRVK